MDGCSKPEICLFYGASVLAKASILNNMRNFMEKPFHILAMIFLAITIGTLCGRDNNMQQTPYYGDPMYQMPNNGYNTQPQSGQSL